MHKWIPYVRSCNYKCTSWMSKSKHDMIMNIVSTCHFQVENVPLNHNYIFIVYHIQGEVILAVTCFKCSLHLYDSVAIFFSSINQFPVLLLVKKWQTSSISISILSYKIAPLYSYILNFISEAAICRSIGVLQSCIR